MSSIAGKPANQPWPMLSEAEGAQRPRAKSKHPEDLSLPCGLREFSSRMRMLRCWSLGDDHFYRFCFTSWEPYRRPLRLRPHDRIPQLWRRSTQIRFDRWRHQRSKALIESIPARRICPEPWVRIWLPKAQSIKGTPCNSMAQDGSSGCFDGALSRCAPSFSLSIGQR